jgi:hypothetical protein
LPSPDMTTVPTGQFALAGLSPARSSTSFTALSRTRRTSIHNSILIAELMRAGRLEEAFKVLPNDPIAYPPPWNQLDALARNYEKTRRYCECNSLLPGVRLTILLNS